MGKSRKDRAFRRLALAVALAASANGSPTRLASAEEGASEAAIGGRRLVVTFLNVGYGDSAFVEFPDGETALVDAGYPWKAFLIRDFLEDIGFSKAHPGGIDYGVVTHFHPDHGGGFLPLTRIQKIRRLIVNRAPRKDDTDPFARHLLRSGGEYEIARAGTRLKIAVPGDEEARIEFLHPPEGCALDLNGCSLVFRLRWKKASFLFAADAFVGPGGEPLDDLKGELASEVLKIPHHGWKTPAAARLVDEVKPSLAILSVGSSSFGAPEKKVLRAYRRDGVVLLRTDSLKPLPPRGTDCPAPPCWGRLGEAERADGYGVRSRYGIVVWTDGERIGSLPSPPRD